MEEVNQIKKESANSAMSNQAEAKSFFSLRNSKGECVTSIISEAGYRVCHTYTERKKDPIFIPVDDLGLCKQSSEFLKRKKISKLWQHQGLAIQQAMAGRNVCITTSTSSGKTEIFQIAALEAIAKSDKAKVLAVYPMKALNRQQVERWMNAIPNVGQIDGDVKNYTLRQQILKDCQVVVMTPDVLHSYLLSGLNDKKRGMIVKNFIKNLSVVIIDELHLYKGVFGTNCAYLFRRLNNLHRLLNGDTSNLQYITSSATLPNAQGHSFNISGVQPFVEIGADVDGSPSSEKTFFFVEPIPDEEGRTGDRLANLVKLIGQIEDAKSITFVEGRQRAGNLANSLDLDTKCPAGFYPYRSGYEIESMNYITQKMHDGDFKGIISTSALEIGIDIEGLNMVVIADMPHDKNSYQQRIGRVGRTNSGDKSFVIVVRTNTFASELLFDAFNYDIDKVLPTYEPALYLNDDRVMNIHAHCHVGDIDNCECLTWKKGNGQHTIFKYADAFPAAFVRRCQEVLDGNYPKSYSLEIARCSNPHHSRPLRFFGDQFTIQASEGSSDTIPREQISRAQVATEGYPGAIRETMRGQERFREKILSFEKDNGVIYADKCKNMSLRTRPYKRRYIRPNFNAGMRNATLYFGDAKVFNLHVAEYCNIYGYYEIYFGNRIYKKYDMPYPLPIFYTTGTVFFHPSFNEEGVQTDYIADIIFETFLKRNAFDRNDIEHINGRIFSSTEEARQNDKFVALYDASMLNITKRLTSTSVLQDLFGFILAHKDVIVHNICPSINSQTEHALVELCNSILQNQGKTVAATEGELHELKFKAKTMVKYLAPDDENPEVIKEVDAMIAGFTDDKQMSYTISVNGLLLFDVSPEELQATETTEFIQ